MMNKKGFTLMEILAVLLVIAVVVSMAVPVLRSVRYEVKNGQAKNAAHKLAQAVRTYYQVSRGGVPRGQSFTPTADRPIVVVKGAAGSGDKYDVSKNKDYLIYVDQSMKVKDSSK